MLTGRDWIHIIGRTIVWVLLAVCVGIFILQPLIEHYQEDKNTPNYNYERDD